MFITMRQKILFKNIKDITPKTKATHEPYAYTKYEVTPRGDFDQCYVAMYAIPPKKANYPLHAHMNNTEVFYIISGEGIMETPEDSQKIKPGDFIVCPPGDLSAHKIINTSDTVPLVYIDFDTTHSPDIVHYPDSDKTGIIIHNSENFFFKNGSEVDYYNGE